MSDLLTLALIGWVAAAWLTHVIACITAAKWLLLLAGAIVFPVGCVHGTGIWLGIF